MTEETYGIVKWFDPQKGYGYITRDRDNRPIYFRSSAIIADSPKSLTEGQQLRFVIIEGNDGPHAEKVELIL